MINDEFNYSGYDGEWYVTRDGVKLGLKTYRRERDAKAGCTRMIKTMARVRENYKLHLEQQSKIS
jgi:hypothetical protein